MSRRQYHADINAVRALVAEGLEELRGSMGELDQVWLDSARGRLVSIDDHLVRAAGGLGSWTRTAIGAAVASGAVWATATGCRALGLRSGWVIAIGLAVLIGVIPLVNWGNNRLAALADRRRLGRVPPPAHSPTAADVGKGRPDGVSEVLLKARVRLVSTILRRAGSRRWQVATLRRLAATDRRIMSLAEADRQLCQAIDFLGIYLDGPVGGRP